MGGATLVAADGRDFLVEGFAAKWHTKTKR
jgi:hypothetical protein